MTDQTATQSRAPEKKRSMRLWFATAALVPYGAVIVALFGGFTFHHLPEGSAIRFAMVASGACLLLLLALWLDRHEAKGVSPPLIAGSRSMAAKRPPRRSR
jgi:zinc transporter ZupT